MSSINFLIVVGVLLLSLCYHLFWYLIEPDLESLCELEAKPLIYGEEQCDHVFGHNIHVTENALVTIFVAFLSPKIIIKGRLDGKPVYLKKLAKDSEMKVVEKLFKSEFKNFKHDKKLIPFLHESMNSLSLSMHHADEERQIQKLQLCPISTDIHRLLHHLPNFTSFDVHQYLNIWTSLHVNPEPILLQILSDPKWPVPRYYGSCGRLAIVEDCGKTITDHMDSSWSLRANLSIQLLEAAFNFTFGHSELAFYLIDPSPDNIAVNDHGIVKFIDLEHIIVVDKHPIDVDANWYHRNHSTIYRDCEDCYDVPSTDICNHCYSDFNIFSVCREILHNSSLILKGGLLHDSPNVDDFTTDNLSYLLQECVNPTEETTRFIIGQNIINLLREHLIK